jgi:hypothetical protein
LSLLSGRQQRRTRLSEPDPEATERTSGGLLRFITQPKQQEPHLFWLAVTGATRLATDASFLPVEPKSPPLSLEPSNGILILPQTNGVGNISFLLLLRFNFKDAPLWWLDEQDISLFQP